MKKIIIFSLFVIILLSACQEVSNAPDDKFTRINVSSSAGDDLKKFNSRQEILDFLGTNAQYSNNYGGIASRTFNMVADSGMEKSAAAPQAVGVSGSGSGADTHSTTNIQVAGVDEADFVKNDGKYIYIVSQDKLIIVDAFPAENGKIVSETKIANTSYYTVNDLFISGDRLVVFTQGYEDVLAVSDYDFVPRPITKQKMHAVVYDISDREIPKLADDYDVSGNYVTSRMIGDYVYVVVQDPVYYYNRYVDLPVVMNGAKVAATPEIYYPNIREDSYTFNTVMSFNIKEDNSVTAKSFMMGYSSNVYVSENNIYITYPKSFAYGYYQQDNEKRFYDAVLPLLPDNVKSEIQGFRNDNSVSSSERMDKISAALEKMYNTMNEDAKKELITKIEQAVSDYDNKLQEDRMKTVIQKIAISKGDIHLIGRGEVPGYLLNQFSMDESGGYFRVATNVQTYTRDKTQTFNNVYIFDSELNAVGKIEGIAPDERIYSTRFLGDRLYMVTFKRMDPLFVIDLSNAEDPKILGELKIPGFSDYLHPYDETHIIGVGKETGENEWGGISTKGLKLALFDVSDVANPKQVDQYIIGEQGTDSEALYEHKAFLFDKAKNLLVIPVREVKGQAVYDPRYGYTTQKIWQGAYVMTVTENGFELKGKISHSEGVEPDWYYYSGPSAVRRSLFMDNVLYTVSMKKILANSLDDVSDQLKEIDLPYEEQRYPYPLYRGGVEGIAIK